MRRIKNCINLGWVLLVASVFVLGLLGCEPKPKKLESVTKPGEGDPFEEHRKNQNKNDVWK